MEVLMALAANPCLVVHFVKRKFKLAIPPSAAAAFPA